MLCYNTFMNDEYYRDEPIYKIRPSNVKAKLKPMFKIENGYFSPYLLNAKPVPASKESYYKYFYMESYHKVEKRKVGGKKQNVTVLHSRKKYVEVPFEQWEKLRYFDLKDYEAARDEYEGTEYEVHKNDRYHNVFDYMLQQGDNHNHEQFWINAIDLERVLNKLSDEDLDIYLMHKEQHLKQKQIAAKLGKSEAHVTRRMKVIEDIIEYDTGIMTDKDKKAFISLFGAILKMRNLLSSFDKFKGQEIISDFDFQDYCSEYLDIRADMIKPNPEKENIIDDVVFEMELIKQIEINIDYILILVQKYHDSHCQDKEVRIAIEKAIDASPELRSKKALIENFINGINEVDDVMAEWRAYIAEEKEKELQKIISEEGLKPEETRKFITNCFRDGEVKTTGTDIANIMPPVSLFGGGDREKKKQSVIQRILAFFERFFGIG